MECRSSFYIHHDVNCVHLIESYQVSCNNCFQKDTHNDYLPSTSTFVKFYRQPQCYMLVTSCDFCCCYKVRTFASNENDRSHGLTSCSWSIFHTYSDQWLGTWIPRSFRFKINCAGKKIWSNQSSIKFLILLFNFLFLLLFTARRPETGTNVLQL